jgi:UDP-glucose 4-epimerase
MTAATPTVLVTGGDGFIGGHVCTALERAGWNVRRAVRTVKQAGGNHIAVGDIGPSTEWRFAVENAAAVVHVAGLAHQFGGTAAAEYFRVNTEGTLKLAAACAGRVPHFVFISSVGVNGASTQKRGPFTEEDAPAPESAYAESKARAEEGLLSLASRSGLNTSIIRPPMVYGRNAKGNFARLSRAVRLGLPLPFGSINNRRAIIAIQNLNSFVLHCLRTPERTEGIFLVADDEQVSTPELVRRIAHAVNRKVYVPRLPPAALRVCLALVGRRSLAVSLIDSCEISTRKARRAGWTPVVPLDHALKNALSD